MVLPKNSAGTLISCRWAFKCQYANSGYKFFYDYVNKLQGGNKGFSHVIMMRRCIFRVDLKERRNWSRQR